MNENKKILTSAKSYISYKTGDHIRQIYSVESVNNNQVVFRFEVPAYTNCQWHFNTDFALNVTDIIVSGNNILNASLTLSDDAKELISNFTSDDSGFVSVSCTAEALSYQETMKLLRTEYDNRLAHIQLLLQTERELNTKIDELNHENKETLLQLSTEKDLCKSIQVQNQQLNQQLWGMQNSRRWRLSSKMASMARKLIPAGGRRAMLIRVMITALRHPVIFLKNFAPKNIIQIIKFFISGDHDGLYKHFQYQIYPWMAVTETPVMIPEIVPIRTGKLTLKDYPVLNVPQWDNPQVSIIIPVYNQFEFTYHCVESILKNSGNATYEILIADDCSTDLTQKITEILPGVRHIRNKENLRFLLNCNNAAKHAKGNYVLFLNNDTQVLNNWLEPLITLIESSEDIGMVGSKLIYPDGSLQEAGGIVWKDGSAWNYGNKQNPELPVFNYVKDVDYISGAAIMLSRKLWEEIGYFDEAFVPSYCEDSDLAFTVHSMGYRVLYQPLSVVVHFEGVSNGTDTSSSLKQYQVINSQKLYEKWKHVLAEHPENGTDVFHAKDRTYGKKTVLFIDHFVPTFDKDAGSRTVFQYIKLFINQGYNVKFIGDNFARMEPYTTVLQQMGVEVLYGNEALLGWRDWMCENKSCFDYAFLNRPHITPNYIDFIRENTDARIIYYGHDLAFLRLQRESEIANDPSLLEESETWLKQELELMRKADMSYYPSYVEVDAIHAIDPSIKVKAIPAYLFEDVNWNGYDMQSRTDIMFIGGFNHRPNVDAAKWMAEFILPELLKLLPNVKIHVLGSNPPQEVLDLENEHLIVEGFVTDEELENFYKTTRLSLVPLRYGAGIKGKVIEALRYGTPVVTTSVGAEGIVGAEKITIIEDDAVKIAHRIAEIYNDENTLTNMSHNGVKYISENFSNHNAIEVIGPDFDMF